MSEIIIRKYARRDFERLFEIDHAAFSEDIAYSHLELQLYTRSPNCHTLVAEDQSEIIGFVTGCSEPRKLGHIITIDVIPHRQRQRVGSLMLAAIEEWLWRRGARAIYLETPVRRPRRAGFLREARLFYI